MRRRIATLLVAVVVVGGTGTGALAFFTSGATSGSHGQAAAGTLLAGSVPTLSLSGRDVTVSWTPSALPAANGGYALERYAAGGGGPIAPGAACGGLRQGSAAFLSCSEEGVPTGRWTYTVSPHYASWVGGESPASPAIVIAPAAPSSVTLTNAVIDNTNARDLEVDVAVPDTSLASDAIRLTISDGSGVVTKSASPAVDGATTIHFTDLDVGGLADGALTFSAKSVSSYGDDSTTTSCSYAKDTVVAVTPSSPTDQNGPVLIAAIVDTTTNRSGTVSRGGGYIVYAEATDALSGVNTASLTANVEAISGGAGGACDGDCASVALAYSVDGFAVANPDGRTSTYHYRSAQLTAQTTLSEGATAFTASGRDVAANTATTGSGESPAASVTVENPAP